MSPRRMDINELLLLGLLAKGGRHGYELHEFLGSSLSYVSDLTRPTAYRILNRLHDQGLLAREMERQGNRPERARYTLTEAGRARMHVLLRASLERDEHAMAPINIPLLFLPELPTDEALRLLSERRAAMTDRYAALCGGLEAHDPGQHERLILERTTVLLKAEIDWLESAEAWVKDNDAGRRFKRP